MLRLPSARFASGVLAGLVLALPLALSGSWVTAIAAARLAGAEAGPASPLVMLPSTTLPSSAGMVNRAAKSSRLPVATASGSQKPALVWAVSRAETSVVSKGEREQARPRTNGTTPRGCLSSVGGLNASIATEEMTVCVADISSIN